jgi:hypothetical protein
LLQVAQLVQQQRDSRRGAPAHTNRGLPPKKHHAEPGTSRSVSSTRWMSSAPSGKSCAERMRAVFKSTVKGLNQHSAVAAECRYKPQRKNWKPQPKTEKTESKKTPKNQTFEFGGTWDI